MKLAITKKLATVESLIHKAHEDSGLAIWQLEQIIGDESLDHELRSKLAGIKARVSNSRTASAAAFNLLEEL